MYFKLRNYENYTTIKKLLEKENVSIHADMMCDETEIRVEAVKRNMGIEYVIKEYLKK